MVQEKTILSYHHSKLDNGGVLGVSTKLDIFSTKDMPIKRVQEKPTLFYCRSNLDNGGVLGVFIKLDIFSYAYRNGTRKTLSDISKDIFIILGGRHYVFKFLRKQYWFLHRYCQNQHQNLNSCPEFIQLYQDCQLSNLTSIPNPVNILYLCSPIYILAFLFGDPLEILKIESIHF